MIIDNVIFFICIVLLSIFYLKLSKISEILNIYDLPDNKRKFHKIKTPIVGGILNLTPILILTIFYNEYYFLIFLVLFTSIGILDDKFSISPNSRLIYLSFSIFLFCILDTKIIINEITFASINKTIDFAIFSIPITILCVLLLTNSLNMIDGINGLCSSYKISSLIIIFIYLIISEKNGIILEKDLQDLLFLKKLIIMYIFVLFIFLIFNIQGKVFLGDSGVYLSSSIFAYILIKIYKISSIFTPEIIFLILFLPGIDMFRVFLVRIYNKKNPFVGDRIHLHHLLLNKFNFNQIILIFLGIQISSLSIFYFYKNFFFILLICLFVYFSLIVKYKRTNDI